MLRLFAALDLPGPAQKSLLELCSGLSAARWVSRDQLHLTLRFIGEVDDSRLDELDAALAALRAPAFRMRLAGVGCFPPRGAPRVLWAGVEADPTLAHLQQAMEKALQAAGLPPEPKPFSPHITLARFRMPPAADAIRTYLERHAAFAVPEFSVTAFHLYSSQLGATGARYSRERSYSLGS